MDNEYENIAEKANNIYKNLKTLHEELLGQQNIQQLEESYEELDDYDYFTEMASVVHDWDNGILIAVDPERNTLNIPYFKVYNSSSYEKASRVARLHFKNSGMEYHKRDKKRSIPTWSLNSSDKQKIIDLLRKPYRKNKKYTNWQALCFEWNDVNGLIGNIDIDEYFGCKYDNKYENHPNSALREAYVPSYQKMPDTWE